MDDGSVAPEVQQLSRSPASPAAPDNEVNLGKVSRPTEHKRVYLLLFNKNPFSCYIVSVDSFVLRQRVLKAYKALGGNIPVVQGGQVAAVPGTGGCIYLVTSHSLVPQHYWL